MRTKLLVLLFVFFIAGCASTPTRTADQAKAEVNALLDGWYHDAATTNFDNYFKVMDSLSVYIAVDASEGWDKPGYMAYSKPFFDRGRAWDFKPLHRNVYLNERLDYAWFNENLDTWMGICNASGVLVYDGKNWKIKHYVLAMAIPDKHVSEVIRLKAATDSTLLMEFRANNH